jgi:hypothetical protein
MLNSGTADSPENTTNRDTTPARRRHRKSKGKVVLHQTSSQNRIQTRSSTINRSSNTTVRGQSGKQCFRHEHNFSQQSIEPRQTRKLKHSRVTPAKRMEITSKTSCDWSNFKKDQERMSKTNFQAVKITRPNQGGINRYGHGTSKNLPRPPNSNENST